MSHLVTMPLSRTVAIFLFCSFTLALSAQQVGSPQPGLAFDPITRSLRPIRGVPGAASLGPPLVENINAASISPAGTDALVVTGTELFAIHSRNTETTWKSIATDWHNLDAAAWNSTSNVAALYSAAANRIVTVAIGGNEPAFREIALESITGRITALAVSSGPSPAILAAVDGAGVYSLSSDRAPMLISPFGHPTAICLDRDERDVLVADSSAQSIVRVSDFQTSGVQTPIAILSGQSVVTGLAVASTRRLFVSDGAVNSVQVYDLSTGSLLTNMDVENSPSFIQPLSGDIFLLGTRQNANQPFYLLDGRRSAVFFLPAGVDH